MKLFGSSSRRGRSPAEDELQNSNSPAEAEYIPAPEEVPKPKRTRKAGDGAPGPNKPGRKRVIAIVVVCVILILCAGTALGAAMVSRSETIYPKVRLGGVDLGGMTVQEAARALERAGYAGEGEGAVTVTLPADVELEVTAGDAGLPTNPQEGAQTAWNYGRDGASALARLGTWLNCLFTGVDLDKEQLPLDEEAIRAKIAAAAEEAQEALLGESVQVGEEEITIIKGGTVVSIDEDAIYDLVAKAMREGDFTEHSYTPQYTGTAENFDFEALHEEIFTEPKDAIYDKETGEVSQSEAGRDFDIEEAERLWAKAQLGDAVVIPLEIQEPKVTTEDLEASLFADCLSQKTTSLGGSSSSRINNIKLACNSINGLVLNPGDEFSYNEALGQRTAAAGYQSAGAYANGEVVNELGGGICQVSSTLYYCTLYANLEIVERYCHYFGVNYLPAGLDATVSWGGPDFKFKNDRDYPIKIEAYVDGGSVAVKIWGTDEDGSYVEMQVDSWNMTNGFGTQSYRLIYDKDGKLVEKRKESVSQYHYHGTTDTPAIATPTPTATPKPTPTPGGETSPPPATDPVVTPPPATGPVDTPPPATDPVTTPPPATPTPPPVTTPVPTPPPATSDGGTAAA